MHSVNSSKVIKHILPNGLTILVLPKHTIPKVSIQLWYYVGSKDEKSGEKGIAHLIEHMVFKGTTRLSECDINLITHKLSGSCNAFTSNDYTGYLFDFPSQHWQESLPIMADCMSNVTFKDEFLNSELKAVIQELKMYKDDYARDLIEHMISAIFADHPYHHPIIGYKQDLWNLDREVLVNFYKKHYIPNNATLIIVGDVDAEFAKKQAEKEFGSLNRDFNYKKEEFYHSSDLISQSVSIYRDVQQPIILCSWVIPGAKVGRDYVLDTLSWILGSGKGSRLYKKLVDELELVTEVETFSYDLFDAGVFFIYLQPKNLQDIETIFNIINDQIENLAKYGPTSKEITRSIKKTEVDYLALLENNQKLAYGIGKYFLATGDEQFLLNYTQYSKENLAQEVKEIITTYLRPSLMHVGKVLPMAASDKKYWALLQEVSDAEDARILAGRTRETNVEESKCAIEIIVAKPKPFIFPKAQTLSLSNGLKVLYYHNPLLPKIDLIIDFKAKHYYDPEGAQGLCSFAYEMLLEGTKKYSGEEFADILESFGMSINTYPGQISMNMLSQDFNQGLELLSEILTHATYNDREIEKVRDQLLAEVKNYWDSPSSFITQLMRESVYKNHPYSKSLLGTEQTLSAISRKDLLHFYRNFISPQAARIVIVGDLTSYDLHAVLEKHLRVWQGPIIEDLVLPVLQKPTASQITYPIARDQIVLGYAGLSVSRLDTDYDKLLLFDQIFGGGILGSMSSRLFDLRERSGLFYTISGSLINKVTKQPGMVTIKTIVSQDRLNEAENAIDQVIIHAADTLTEDEITQAKDAVINSLVDNFSSNYQTATSLLFQDVYQLPYDYFDTRAEQITLINKNQVQEAVKRWLNINSLVKIKVGRI